MAAATSVPSRRSAPLDRRSRYRLGAILLGLLVLALIVIVVATGGGGGTATPPPAHHRQRSSQTIPHAADPARQARLLARWLRQHAG